MQREEALPRLSGWSIKTKDPVYIHLYFLINDLRQALANHCHGYLLDLGCGNKPYATLYNRYCEKSIGCDIMQSDKNMVDVICLATELSFANQTFDTVLSTQVLEHVYDGEKMIAEAFRILKPKGKVILTVPFAWELHEEPFHYKHYTKHGLQKMFEDAGFIIDYIKPNGGKWAAIYQLRTSMMYSSFKNKTWYNKIKRFFFMELRLTQLRNHFAIWIDKKFRDEILTLNYIVVATKP